MACSGQHPARNHPSATRRTCRNMPAHDRSMPANICSMTGVRRWGRHHHIRREKFLCRRAWQWRLDRRVERGGAGHTPRVQILLGHHDNLVAADRARQVADQLALILE